MNLEEHYANENNDYQEDTHKGTFTSCIESSSLDCYKWKVAHRISMRYFFMYKKIPLYEGF